MALEFRKDIWGTDVDLGLISTDGQWPWERVRAQGSDSPWSLYMHQNHLVSLLRHRSLGHTPKFLIPLYFQRHINSLRLLKFWLSRELIAIYISNQLSMRESLPHCTLYFIQYCSFLMLGAKMWTNCRAFFVAVVFLWPLHTHHEGILVSCLGTEPMPSAVVAWSQPLHHQGSL